MAIASSIALLGLIHIAFNFFIISFHPGVVGIPLTLPSTKYLIQGDYPRHSTGRTKRWIYSAIVGTDEQAKKGDEGDRKLSPIIFLPGTGGSQLEAKMERTHAPPEGCPNETSWYRLWLDIMYIFSGNLHCWADAMKLHYNHTSKRSNNAPGFQTRVPNFGVTDSIEYIDPSWVAWAAGIGAYAAPLVEALHEWGYVREKNLRGAPYDFRYAPHSLTEFYKSLKFLIERTYVENGNRRVTLMAHSMGGLVGIYFLNRQPQNWKSRYIHRFVSLNTPWKGTVVATQGFVSGINWDRDEIDPWVMRDQQRSQESATMLLPSKLHWPKDEIIVSTPSKNYTVNELYDRLFEDIKYPVGKEMAKNVQTKDYIQENPGVKMYCLYTYGQPTPRTLVYGDGLSNEKRPEKVIYGDGDGSVNYLSLRGCRDMRFKSGSNRFRPRHRVYLRGFEGPAHDGIFTDARVLEKLKHILTITRKH